MNALYTSPSGRYFVQYCALDGSYEIRDWPEQRVLANRDWLADAKTYCLSLEREDAARERLSSSLPGLPVGSAGC